MTNSRYFAGGGLVRQVRLALQMTQPEMGAILGIHQSYVSKIETGANAMTSAQSVKFKALCRAHEETLKAALYTKESK